MRRLDVLLEKVVTLNLNDGIKDYTEVKGFKCSKSSHGLSP